MPLMQHIAAHVLNFIAISLPLILLLVFLIRSKKLSLKHNEIKLFIIAIILLLVESLLALDTVVYYCLIKQPSLNAAVLNYLTYVTGASKVIAYILICIGVHKLLNKLNDT